MLGEHGSPGVGRNPTILHVQSAIPRERAARGTLIRTRVGSNEHHRPISPSTPAHQRSTHQIKGAAIRYSVSLYLSSAR